MTETEIEKRGGGVVLADSPALHSSLTVSPMFILFVGAGEAHCSTCTLTHTHSSKTIHRCTHAYAHPQGHTQPRHS